MQSLEEVAACRAQLWQAGFRPVPILGINAKVSSPGKQPLGDKWQEAAREDPPFCVRNPAVAHAPNTGILCDALRAFDFDIDDPAIARECRAIAIATLGDAPARIRPNSPRSLLLYRAAEGEPQKISMAGTHGKIEVLGRGQQFVAFGTHPSGAELEWQPVAPGEQRREDLVAVTEAQVREVLVACAPLIGAQPPQQTNGEDHEPGEPQADPLRIAAALNDIPNNGPKDWEWWNKVAMAVWRATGGSEIGWHCLNAWSARNVVYDARETRARWDHFRTSPPTQIGAGSLFRYAAEARQARREAPPDDRWREDEPRPVSSRLRLGEEMLASFSPPDWLIDGILQRGRLYSCTSLTGHGKTAVWLFNSCMIQAGRLIGARDIDQGNVLYLAGENPEDIKARLRGMCLQYRLDRNKLPLFIPGSFPLTDEGIDELRKEIDAFGQPLALIVGDTAASFFPGDDENDNVAAGHYARGLRRLTDCKGNPAVVALAHPIKNASKGNLLPRGGGAFLNELDGNLTLWSEDIGAMTTLHWQGKIRGPDFSPFSYQLKTVGTGFTDKRSRPVMTIVAEPVSDETAAARVQQILADDLTVLRMLHQHDWSFAEIARQAGWLDDGDQPQKWMVKRSVDRLADDKLVTQARKGDRWTLTEKGERLLKP